MDGRAAATHFGQRLEDPDVTRPQKLTLFALLALSCGCAAQIPDDVYLTNHDVFDLTCAGATPADTRVLHVDIDARGQFAISFVEGGERTHVDARTYTNAITWTQGGDPWILDRFTGTLSSKAANQRLVCERTGGRKFCAITSTSRPRTRANERSPISH